jgi:hypothetical protein
VHDDARLVVLVVRYLHAIRQARFPRLTGADGTRLDGKPWSGLSSARLPKNIGQAAPAAVLTPCAQFRSKAVACLAVALGTPPS